MNLHWTLPDLLLERSGSSAAGISFLDDNGHITRSISYRTLYQDAQDYAQRLLISGIQPKDDSVVIARFDDHYNHILLFWACLLGKVRTYVIDKMY
jgi:acyl-CoA synthetase (AMP-forming)/AMP-acid ligase II